MKPSEKRALDAEKRAQREAEQREKLLEAKSRRQERDVSSATRSPATPSTEERMNANAAYRKLPEEEIKVSGDGYHREGFFSRHVKLITFIICLTLILTVIGPWGIDRLVDKGREEVFGKEVDSKSYLSVNSVVLLADLGESLTWDHLQNFHYVDYSYEKDGVTTHIREYDIEGTNLVLRVGGTEVGKITEYEIFGIVIFRDADLSLPQSPEYVRLIEYSSGDYVDDIRKEDISAFLSQHQ